MSEHQDDQDKLEPNKKMLISPVQPKDRKARAVDADSDRDDGRVGRRDMEDGRRAVHQCRVHDEAGQLWRGDPAEK
ncbi:hypothetical protein PR003_g12966 [Phytophthora rubi]|uniref:Uncharacterized protein n=1 Tax=Phytophthora rubi TaxID=129364 RepID=A0A6A3LEI2_9STRA|nr:hypothetical protein PR001_g14302 [Phytophthora rubi]KAE9030343.1 hypothetical protein PR002_g9912 [Phytophthora rubi]KAE9335531.1 hypothetical protein PR003_g12966 [Phytophthora rubi]